HARVVGGVLARGIRVEMAADRFDLDRDFAGVAALGAFECHVFEQVGDAVDGGRLVARAGADPYADGGGLDPGHRVGGDDEAVIQAREAKAIDSVGGGRNTHHAAPFRRRLRIKPWTVLRSLASTSTRSGRSSRSARRVGSGGRSPVARSTASGNLAGWAVASAITGPPRSRAAA